MTFAELVAARHSVRAYRRDPVPEEALARVLEAGRLAPTACNRQPFRLLVARTADREAELAQVYRQPWFSQAPLLLGVLGLPGEAWIRPYDSKNHVDVDAAIAMDHMILAATAEGLGTCWVCAFDPAEARRVFELPPEVEPIAFSPLGFAAGPPRETKRKPLASLVCYERWT